jgi:hypothetical protein
LERARSYTAIIRSPRDVGKGKRLDLNLLANWATGLPSANTANHGQQLRNIREFQVVHVFENLRESGEGIRTKQQKGPG